MPKGRLLCAVLGFAVCAAAQVPASELAKPPANARHFVIESTGGKHGDSWSWADADGSRGARESMNLRGMVTEIDYKGKPGADGMPASVEIRGVTPTGDAAETFSISSGQGWWKSQMDSGSTDDNGPAFYTTLGGPMDTNAWFLERLLASPNRTMKLLPAGEARATKVTTLDVGSGAKKQTVTLWAVTGVSTTPLPVWADVHDKFFAVTLGLNWIPDDYVGERDRMEKAQAAAMAAQAPMLARTLVQSRSGPLAFTKVRVFDADNLTFLNDQTVVVDKGLIAAVGPASSTIPPAGALVIDGTGKTLLPGPWDCHMHVGDDYTGVQELSLGVTSVRDPGNNDKLTIDRRTRAAAGQLLLPHVYPSSLIDGKGTYTAQVANVATTQAEAIALVDKAKQNEFTGVKFYGTFNPEWLPAATAEAHKLGLHVHGHIPAGMRPTQAIEAGYDEITHINWIIMQVMPESVLPVDNGIMRFEGPGRYARDVDLDGPEMQSILTMMARKKIYSDPTMVAF